MLIINIPGFTIGEKLYTSINSTIYLAKRDVDSVTVVLKMLSTEYPSSEQISKLYLEYEICCELDIDGIIRMHSFERNANLHAIVMDFFDGQPLGNFIILSKTQRAF